MLTYLAVRDYELNELLTGFFDIRGGGESASAWSVVLADLTVRDDELNESLIVRSWALESLVEALRKVGHWVTHTLH